MMQNTKLGVHYISVQLNEMKHTCSSMALNCHVHCAWYRNGR